MIYDIHTRVYLLLINGVNAKVIQERLRHARINVTLDTYAHIIGDLEAISLTKVENIFLF